MLVNIYENYHKELFHPPKSPHCGVLSLVFAPTLMTGLQKNCAYIYRSLCSFLVGGEGDM